MTLTIAMDSSLEKADKQGRIFGLSARGIKLALVTVTFGAADNYATNGVTADLKVNGLKDIYAAIPVFNDAGVTMRYDIANGKILMYGYSPTDATAGVIAFAELANASTITQSKKFTFLVIGK